MKARDVNVMIRVLLIAVFALLLLTLINFRSSSHLFMAVDTLKKNQRDTNGSNEVVSFQQKVDHLSTVERLLEEQQRSLSALNSEMQALKEFEVRRVKEEVNRLSVGMEEMRKKLESRSYADDILPRVRNNDKIKHEAEVQGHAPPPAFPVGVEERKKIDPLKRMEEEGFDVEKIRNMVPQNEQRDKSEAEIKGAPFSAKMRLDDLPDVIEMHQPVQVEPVGDENMYRRKFVWPKKRYAGTIFVSAASYNDEICPHTLEEMFRTAKEPDKVFVGLIQQNLEGTSDCLEKYCLLCSRNNTVCRRSQVRSIKVDATRATGVMPARYLATTLFAGEEYFFQIDAHSRFSRNWDEKLVKDLKMIPYDRAVLSTHPIAHSYYQEEGDLDAIVNLCVYKWDPTNLPRFSGQITSKRTYRVRSPSPGVFIGSGLVFGRAELLIDCPFDPHYEFLFSGEELLFAVCLWTHGWDMYNPTVSVIFHYYDDPRKHAIRLPVNEDKRRLSAKRLLYVLDIDKDIDKDSPVLAEVDKYLMGTHRKLEDYWKYAKIDWKSKEETLDWCSMPKKVTLSYEHQKNIKQYPVGLERLPQLS